MDSRKCAIALGLFDGVHKGHKAVLDGAIKSGYKSVAVTFSTIPFKSGGSLMTNQDREKKLLEYGIEEVLFLDFFEIKDYSPDAFLEFLLKKYNIGKICCGFNYRFGKKAAGDTEFLDKWCKAKNIEFFECPEVKINGNTVSSTYIKELISQGKIKEAKLLLDEDFYFTANVKNGEKRGRTMGFPTINQLYPEGLTKPKFGVYQTVVTIDGKRYDGVTNIGVRPTFITDYISAETYILGFDRFCYGEEVKVSLIEFLREEKKFSNKEELIKAIKENAEYVEKNSRI